MPSIDLPTVILTQVPSRTQLADTRALMQRVQAAAEQAWERELTWKSLLPPLEVPEDEDDAKGERAWG